MPAPGRKYSPLAYPPAENAVWSHFLYGHVPGWQLDFIARPRSSSDIPPQYTAALRPLLSQIDPQKSDAPAFAIGNLSLHQDSDRPGRGALALLYGQRFGNITDHAGRKGAFFSHAAVASRRKIQPEALRQAMREFERRITEASGRFFQRYYHKGWAEQDGQIQPRCEAADIMGYLRGFADLGKLEQAEARPEVLQLEPAGESPRDCRVLVLCADDVTRESKLSLMANLAAALYRSDVPWVWLTTDLLPSISPQPEVERRQLEIHLVPESLCPQKMWHTLERTRLAHFNDKKDAAAQLKEWLKPLPPGASRAPSQSSAPTGSGAESSTASRYVRQLRRFLPAFGAIGAAMVLLLAAHRCGQHPPVHPARELVYDGSNPSPEPPDMARRPVPPPRDMLPKPEQQRQPKPESQPTQPLAPMPAPSPHEPKKDLKPPRKKPKQPEFQLDMPPDFRPKKGCDRSWKEDIDRPSKDIAASFPPVSPSLCKKQILGMRQNFMVNCERGFIPPNLKDRLETLKQALSPSKDHEDERTCLDKLKGVPTTAPSQ